MVKNLKKKKQFSDMSSMINNFLHYLNKFYKFEEMIS